MATELDSIVEAYEQARAEGQSVALRRFLPTADSDSYRDVALELMRVDLEYSWQSGNPRRLDEYLAEHGDVLADRAALAALAYEEFRLRRAAGQAVRRDEYARRFAIDVSSWPDDAPPTSAAKFPRAGERLLGFQLVRELGRGAFGRVYLAEQADLAHRNVAVKVTTELTVEPERLAQLQHANIVPIYSLHRHEGLQVLCMPYRGDRTLADWLRERRGSGDASRRSAHETEDARLDDTNSFRGETPTTPSRNGAPETLPAATAGTSTGRVDEALRILLGVASGLAHAHRRGIVHRDLKPANVLISNDGMPLLLDFNLATEVRNLDANSNGVGGTLPYMSPEQLLSLESGEAVDATSDVYACGVLLVEMLTGKRPFPEINAQGRALWRTMRAQRLQGYHGFAELTHVASSDVASIARKCLAPDKASRYSSAAELETDLLRHLEHLPLQYAANRSLAERARKWTRRHPRLGSGASVGLLAAVLLACAVAVIYVRGRDVARLDAVGTREAYLRSVPEIRAALTTPDLEPALAKQAIDEAENLLRPYFVDATDDWREADRVQLLNEAERELLVHDIDATLTSLTTAIDRLPDDERRVFQVAGWHNLASQAGNSSDPSFAMDELTKLREAAARRLLAREYAEAATAARRWADLAPQDFEAQFLLAIALVGSGRADEAELCYSICTALSPKSLLAFYQRGVCRLELRMWAGARDDFSRVLAMRPRLAAALVNRAVAREKLGDVPGAIDDLSAAIATNEAPTRAYFMRAQLYMRQGESDKGKADRERGLVLQPNDTLSWIARGVAQVSTSPEKALGDFQSALKLSPREANALQNSANVLSGPLERPKEAIAALTKLLEFRPTDADALAGRAVLYARLGRSDEALADVVRLGTVSRTAEHPYQTACVYSLLSNGQPPHRAEALRLLAVAFQQDAQLAELAPRDPDLAALREDPEFQRIISAAQALRQAGRTETNPQP